MRKQQHMFAEIMNRHTDPNEENDDLASQSGKESLDGQPPKKNSKGGKRNSFSYFDGIDNPPYYSMTCFNNELLIILYR